MALTKTFIPLKDWKIEKKILDLNVISQGQIKKSPSCMATTTHKGRHIFFPEMQLAAELLLALSSKQLGWETLNLTL